MIGGTVQSGKKQALCYTLRGRQATGSFTEDLAKVFGSACFIINDNIIL
jgi:hypothetical protein